MLSRRSCILAGALAATTLTAGTVMAGSNNIVDVRQESPGGAATGNSLTIDQSLANDSRVRGFADNRLRVSDNPLVNIIGSGFLLLENTNLLRTDGPALQSGSGNVASIDMTGDGGEVRLLQDNSQAANPDGNAATITTNGQALGALVQVGSLNDATLSVADGGVGRISQFGTGLTADLGVGTDAQGQIVQIGRGSTAELQVMDRGSATYVQIGNNLQSIGQTDAVQVFTTNPGNITITQTRY